MRFVQPELSGPWAMTQSGFIQVRSLNEYCNDLNPKAVTAIAGERLKGTGSVVWRDGVAVIPIVGPIFRYQNLLTWLLGWPSIEGLALDFTAALNHRNVRAIVLEIDSPGGELNGVSEFSKMVAAARPRKPIVAYVGGLAASAAYWIASATHSIVVDKTAFLGGIGVILSVEKPRKGTIEIVSTQSPKKRRNPMTSSGRADIQRTVDDLADVFISQVATYRRRTFADVAENFGRGRIVIGEDAVVSGMADRLGSQEKLIRFYSHPHKRS